MAAATEFPLVPASDLGLGRKKQILEAWAAANENMHLSNTVRFVAI